MKEFNFDQLQEPSQEPSQGIPNNLQITQQPPLKFRLKKSRNPNHFNSFPQLAFQNNIYYFSRKIKSPVCLFYRCKNCNQHCKGNIHVSYDQKVIKQTAHSCNGYIDNAKIVSVSCKSKFNFFVRFRTIVLGCPSVCPSKSFFDLNYHKIYKNEYKLKKNYF